MSDDELTDEEVDAELAETPWGPEDETQEASDRASCDVMNLFERVRDLGARIPPTREEIADAQAEGRDSRWMKYHPEEF